MEWSHIGEYSRLGPSFSWNHRDPGQDKTLTGDEWNDRIHSLMKIVDEYKEKYKLQE